MIEENSPSQRPIDIEEMRTEIPDIPERFSFDDQGKPVELRVGDIVYKVEAEENSIPASIFFDPNNKETIESQQNIRVQYMIAALHNMAFTNEKHLYARMRLDGADIAHEFVNAQRQRIQTLFRRHLKYNPDIGTRSLYTVYGRYLEDRRGRLVRDYLSSEEVEVEIQQYQEYYRQHPEKQEEMTTAEESRKRLGEIYGYEVGLRSEDALGDLMVEYAKEGQDNEDIKRLGDAYNKFLEQHPEEVEELRYAESLIKKRNRIGLLRRLIDPLFKVVFEKKFVEENNKSYVPPVEKKIRDINYKANRGINEIAHKGYYEEESRHVDNLIEILRMYDVPIVKRTVNVYLKGVDEPPTRVTRFILGDYVRRGDKDSWNGAELGTVMGVMRAQERLGIPIPDNEIVIYSLGNLTNFISDHKGEVAKHGELEMISYAVDETQTQSEHITFPEISDPEEAMIEDTTEAYIDDPMDRSKPIKMGDFINEDIISNAGEYLLGNMGFGGYAVAGGNIAINTGYGVNEMMKMRDDDPTQLVVNLVEYDLPVELERRATMHEVGHYLDPYFYWATMPQKEAFAMAFELDYYHQKLREIAREQKSFENPINDVVLKKLFAELPEGGQKRWGNNFAKTYIYHITGAFYSYLYNYFDSKHVDSGKSAGAKLMQFHGLISGGERRGIFKHRGKLERVLKTVFEENDEELLQFMNGFYEEINKGAMGHPRVWDSHNKERQSPVSSTEQGSLTRTETYDNQNLQAVA